jgi:hypothetical protein
MVAHHTARPEDDLRAGFFVRQAREMTSPATTTALLRELVRDVSGDERAGRRCATMDSNHEPAD